MEINWQPEARKVVKNIYYFYESKSKIVANEIVEDINTSAKYLAIFPKMAPIEPALEGRSETFRALLVRNRYKIIYYINETANEIVIVTVWDCYQNPQKWVNLTI
jgi:plasmid stabilization system protein ParE